MSSSTSCKPVKAVLFDMDGLLIDSEGVYTKVVNVVLEPYGFEQGWDLKQKLMGRPERKAVEILLGYFWPPRDGKAEAFNEESCPFTIDSFLANRNMNLDEEFSKVKPMPGAQRLIDHLVKHNVPICVATGSKTRNFKIKSAANIPLFEPFKGRVVCGDDERLSRGKPFPDVFLLATREGLGEAEKWKEGIRELGEEHDGSFEWMESQVLVFEDATVSTETANGSQVNRVFSTDLPRITTEWYRSSQCSRNAISMGSGPESQGHCWKSSTKGYTGH